MKFMYVCMDEGETPSGVFDTREKAEQALRDMFEKWYKIYFTNFTDFMNCYGHKIIEVPYNRVFDYFN